MKTDYFWLDNWASKIRGKSVLELGAGDGIDTLKIQALANNLTATDLIENKAKGIQKLDHSHDLPFASKRFDIVIASLCLHYFNWYLTTRIIHEIHRVLKPNGILIGRVNSKRDIYYGAIGYPEIEPGLFNVNNKAKRLFNKAELESLFDKEWSISSILERDIDRYKMNKSILEFSAARTVDDQQE